MEAVVRPILVEALREPGRRPELRLAAGVREAGRHDTDDRERLRVEEDARSENARVGAEPGPPEGVGDEKGPRRPGAVVLGSEEPAEGGGRPEELQDLGGGHRAVEAPRLAAADEIRGDGHRRAQPSEGGAHAFPVPEVGGRRLHLAVAAVRLVLPYPHQPVGLGERQRPEQDVVEDREGGRRGADAERGDEDDRGREPGRASERPERVPQVLPQDVEVGARRVGEDVEGRTGDDRGPSDRALRLPEARRDDRLHLAGVLRPEGCRVQEAQQPSVEPHQAFCGAKPLARARRTRPARRFASARATAWPKGVMR